MFRTIVKICDRIKKYIKIYAQIVIKNITFFLSYKKEKMPNLSTKEKKAKRRIVVKEFNDELLNLVMIQYEMKKLDVIWQKQIIKINEMHDKIEERKELIEYLTISPAKNNNREKTAIKMLNRLKPELECKQDLVTRE